MQTVSSVQHIDEQIAQLQKQLLALGPLHPGSLSQQHQVCGKPGCKCHDPHHPRPHGPYAKLTYVYHGKFTCRFVRAQAVEEVSLLLANFKKFRQLTDQWVALAIERAQLGPLQRQNSRSKPTKTTPPPTKRPSKSKTKR